MKKLRIIFIILIPGLFCYLFSPVVFSQSHDLGIYTKEILILQSYQRDYYHTRVLEEGIEAVLANSGEKVRIRYEFLDAKNSLDFNAFQTLAETLTPKYKEVSLDGLIICDDDALQFYNRFGKTIWPNTVNVVSTGINSLRPYSEGIPGMVIIEERPDVEKNIAVALEQNQTKDIKTLHFIYDETTTSNEMRSDIIAMLADKYPNYQSQHYYDKTPDDLKTIIDSSGSSDLFFYVLYSRDKNNITYHYDEVPQYILKNAQNPVYALWDFYLGTGVVGGYVASSYKYGESAANTLLDLWAGQSVSSLIYEDGSHYQYMFDYDVLKTYQLSNVPEGSIIINEPVTYFEKNKNLIILFSVITGVLVMIIGLLLYAIREKNSLNQKTIEIADLNQEIVDTQKVLITKLGAVIETRSFETANHVKRVARVSSFLAQEYGLSERDVAILTAVSPMHDVGKIGIGENILHKPGRLSEQEFEIMKYHTSIGYEILKNPEREMLRYASLVALEHHEKWGGGGYPSGKSGEDIHVFARITAIADVYDALRSIRVYKDAWSQADAVSYLIEESGKFFEPKLVNIFVSNIEQIETIRGATYEDELNDFSQMYHYLKEQMDE
ncbi:HD domain-containing phosphohydrolase [Acetobacterium malicum]|uniref:HD domain-containing protein n=1 Tax=Acetobacterium malicum TaxID=52692 RepID=A0ABR6YZM6_9FIRM|nr:MULTISPECIES: HD domain-containing phosphohydrolase [Acetobacterium]MBC3900307.1 HD domain-containing protein [Acetobacterium malicum]